MSSITILGLFLLFAPNASLAAQYIGQENYIIPEDKTIEENIYAGGSTIMVNGTAAKDVIAGGNTIEVSGIIKDDAIFAGGAITVTGTIEDDLRIAGGTFVFSGTVLGDINVASGTVTFSKDALVQGDVTIAAGTATINGNIEGGLEIAGGQITLSGTVQKNVEARVGMLTITDSAIINGDLNYESEHVALIAQGAQIEGATHFNQHQVSRMNSYFGVAGIGIAGFIFSLIGSLIAALALVLLFKSFSAHVVKEGITSYWRMTFIGLILGIVMPVLSILLMVTVAGIPIGVMLFVIYITIMIFGGLYAGMLLGAFVMKWIRKQQEIQIDWRVPVLGIILMNAIAIVPVIGWIIVFLFFLAGVGAFAKTFYTLLADKH